MLRGKRRGRITEDDILHFLHILRSFDLFIDRWVDLSPLNGIRKLADRHRLTSNDAAYLDLALRKGLPLATLDESLRRAGKAENVVVL